MKDRFNRVLHLALYKKINKNNNSAHIPVFDEELSFIGLSQKELCEGKHDARVGNFVWNLIYLFYPGTFQRGDGGGVKQNTVLP